MRILMATAALGVLLAGCSDKGDDQLQYFNCGETPIKIQNADTQMTLSVDDATYTLTREGEGDNVVYKDDTVTFTPTAEGATLQVNGQQRPACRPVVWKDTDDVTHFKAFGNEPGWLVEVSPALVKVVRGTDGQTYAQGRPMDEALRKSYSLNDGDVKVSIKTASKNEPCRDTMSGQYFAHHVTLKIDGETYQGCGDNAPAYDANPASLTRAMWILEDIDGKGIVDRSNLSLRINDRGYINADTMCGRYAAEYKTQDQKISFEELKPIGRRSCRGEALQEQQTRFLDILGNVQNYAYQMDGGLVLFTDDDRVLLFRER